MAGGPAEDRRRQRGSSRSRARTRARPRRAASGPRQRPTPSMTIGATIQAVLREIVRDPGLDAVDLGSGEGCGGAAAGEPVSGLLRSPASPAVIGDLPRRRGGRGTCCCRAGPRLPGVVIGDAALVPVIRRGERARDAEAREHDDEDRAGTEAAVDPRAREPESERAPRPGPCRGPAHRCRRTGLLATEALSPPGLSSTPCRTGNRAPAQRL